jgi:hypothetical protein
LPWRLHTIASIVVSLLIFLYIVQNPETVRLIFALVNIGASVLLAVIALALLAS